MKALYYFFIFGIILSCNKDTFDNNNFYQDDFESCQSETDLVNKDGTTWSYLQLTKDDNMISVDNQHFHSGGQSIQFSAIKSSQNSASKASIAKQEMAFYEDESVRISAWYFIQGNDDLNWLFLMDLEERINIGADPGMRLAMVNNQLRIEFKYNEKDIIQTPNQAIDFPRNQWVEVVWEVFLSQKKEGVVKLWQNGKLIIDSVQQRTLPKDLLYFQQGTQGMYNSIEIGITANSVDNDAVIWVDDFLIEKID